MGNPKASPQDAKPPRRKRSVWERSLVWGGILVLLGVVTFEWRTRAGYDATLANLDKRLAGQPVLPLAELSSHTHGYYTQQEQKNGKKRSIILHWPSLFKVYKLRLGIQDPDSVFMVEAVTPEDVAVADNKVDKPQPNRAIPPRIQKEPGLSKEYDGTIALNTALAMSGSLRRELVRQALLMAAQEELGVPTLDPCLGSSIPLVDAPHSYPFTIYRRLAVEPPRKFGEREEDRDVKFTIELTRPTVGGPPFTWTSTELILPPNNQIETLARMMQPFIRGPFVEAWQKAGYKKADKPAPASREPVEFEDRMDIVSQFTRLREYHQRIRAAGETPESLAEIVRAYSNLGNLTDFYWRATSKAFKARSLLFAERLIAKTGETPFSLAHRAYALALAGRHVTGHEAVLAAKAAQGQAAPEWLDIIDLYCEFKLEELSQTKTSFDELAEYLQMRMVDSLDVGNEEAVKAIEHFKTKNAACGRWVEMLGEIRSLGIQGSLAEAYDVNWRETYQRMTSVKGLPASVANLARQAADAVGEPEEFELRQGLMNELATIKNTDEAVPSWSMLAELLRDESFVQAYRLLAVQFNWYGQDAGKQMKEMLPMVQTHPFAKFLETMTGDPRRRTEKMKELLENMDRSLCETPALPIVRAATSTPGLPRDPQHSLGGTNRDDIWEDMDRIGGGIGFSVSFYSISPKRPRMMAEMIEHQWHEVQHVANDWERDNANHPIVLLALAKAYHSQHRLAAAKRCLNAAIAHAPSMEAYRKLAEIYQIENNFSEWEKALLAALELPSFGLESTGLHRDLAQAYMKKGQWDKAEPHAMKAAASGAEWALVIGARCAEGKGEWDKAEQLMRSASRAYNDPGWYFWCLRTGRGNLSAASTLVDTYFKPLDKVQDKRVLRSSQCRELAAWHLLEGDVTKARELYESSASYSREGRPEITDGLVTVYAAILADLDGDKEACKKLLNRFGGENLGMDDTFSEFANLVAGVISEQEVGRWNAREFERLAIFANQGYVPSMYYFAGLLLRNHGQKELANEYIHNAATAFAVGSHGCVLANNDLRQLNATVAPTRLNDVPDSIAPLANTLREARVAYENEQYDRAMALLNDVLKQRADFIPALLFRGQLLYEIAEYDEAKAVYEEVVKLDPNNYHALDTLAWLMATCEMDSLRNGKKAVEYAERAAELRFFPWSTAATTLGVAYAEAGDFDRAKEFGNKFPISVHAYSEIFEGRSIDFFHKKPYTYHPERAPANAIRPQNSQALK